MLEIYVDTVKMRATGNEILKLVEELKQTIDAMFTRIANIPVTTKEWVGDSSVAFADSAMRDKAQYITYVNSLYKYGKYLIDAADYFDQTIAKVKRG